MNFQQELRECPGKRYILAQINMGNGEWSYWEERSGDLGRQEGKEYEQNQSQGSFLLMVAKFIRNSNLKCKPLSSSPSQLTFCHPPGLSSL